MYGAIKQPIDRPARGDQEGRVIQGRARLELAHSKPTSECQGRPDVLNMCANNYLGLANHREVVQAAHDALNRWGNGLASVRFICGTQEPHKELEKAISAFLGTEDTILYSSCWDANGGLFETILADGGRRHLRRAQPRLDHRRHPAVQGPPPALQE